MKYSIKVIRKMLTSNGIMSHDDIFDLEAALEYIRINQISYWKRRPVSWKGQIFESITALSKECRMSTQAINYYIKSDRKFLGSKIEYIES
jgi:hypothetical protein